jgi:hypothetical protein
MTMAYNARAIKDAGLADTRSAIGLFVRNDAYRCFIRAALASSTSSRSRKRRVRSEGVHSRMADDTTCSSLFQDENQLTFSC